MKTLLLIILLWLPPEFECEVIRVYDGDTIFCDLKLGLGIALEDQSIRLADIDAPEVRGEERQQGLMVRDILRDKLTGKLVIIEIPGKDKYGRWLGTVYLDSLNINEWLVEEGYAEVYE